MKSFSPQIIKQLTELMNKLHNDELEGRFEPEGHVEYRTAFERDCSRIMYSSSFRRLQEKMQLLGVETAVFHRNRLSHSLEVLRVSHSIAEYLNKKCGGNGLYLNDDFHLLDAAALAHDIGHPAFGHKGERVLDEIAKVYGMRFEGNAQNYRVLRILDRNGCSAKGLNLTYRTLLAINKYCECENLEYTGSTKFMYKNDYDDLLKIRNTYGLGTSKTLDVQIIELADDIAYVTHDLEDGLSLSITTLEELNYAIRNYGGKLDEKSSRNLLKDAANLFEKLQKSVKQSIDKAGPLNQQLFMHLFRKELVSELLTEFVENIEYNTNSQELELNQLHHTLRYVLSKVTFRNVNRNSNIAVYEARGEIVIKSLFNIYANENINKNYSLLPPDYQPKGNERAEITRNVIDYIAGMSDTFAQQQFKILTGCDFNDINIGIIPEIYNI